jgi:hypothetical protein
MRLSRLRPLYERHGPWTSVYLDVSRNTEHSAEVLQTRWRETRDALAAAGSEDATLAALEPVVLQPQGLPGRHGLAVFAAGGSVHHTELLSGPPRREIADVALLPHTLPLAAQAVTEVPYLRVLVDHTGGDIEYAAVGRLSRTQSVEGSTDFPLRKVNPGGWRQNHVQQSVDESWRRNAGEVAEAAVALADRYDVEVFVIAGDPRSRPMLLEQLPDRWRRRVVLTDVGSRGAGADPSRLEELTIQAVADQAAADDEALLGRYRSERDRQGAAAIGLPAVVAALQRGQVDTVLLVDDPSSTAELWVGPQALELAFDPQQLRSMNVEPLRVRADAALMRAIVCSDAELVFVGPDDLGADETVAAVLRYADPATRHR